MWEEFLLWQAENFKDWQVQLFLSAVVAAIFPFSLPRRKWTGIAGQYWPWMLYFFVLVYWVFPEIGKWVTHGIEIYKN